MNDFYNLLEKSTKKSTTCGEFLSKITGGGGGNPPNVAFFGAGLYCSYMLELFKREDVPLPIAICDNNEKRWGTTFFDVPVMSLTEVLEQNKNVHFLITAPSVATEIKQQLTAVLPREQVSSFSHEEYDEFDTFKEFTLNHKRELLSIYNQLGDSKSKNTLVSVLNGRCTGDEQYYIDVFDENQYFPKDLIDVSTEEVFLDVGGYIGDTIDLIIKNTNGKYKKIITVEPNPANHKMIEEKMNTFPHIELLKLGASDKAETLLFDSCQLGSASASFDTESGDIQLNVDRLDDMVHEKVTFIKMDIEGFEMNALRGAIQLIQQYRPKLAISLYHKSSDFVEIPQFLDNLNLDYKFYIRHHSRAMFETVLYAI